jgi:hypothetical protein
MPEILHRNGKCLAPQRQAIDHLALRAEPDHAADCADAPITRRPTVTWDDAGMPAEDRTKWQDERVRLVPHNPEWAARFEEEAVQVRKLMSRWITGGVHHVGSTAVPGLDAKPIIDIAVGVETPVRTLTALLGWPVTRSTSMSS